MGNVLQAERNLTGIMNFTNPGAISHNEMLELYKEHIDPRLTYHNFTVEEQAKVIVAPRSNNLLDTKRVSAATRVPHFPVYRSSNQPNVAMM
jgi:3,5-epimerase/4-reductase